VLRLLLILLATGCGQARTERDARELTGGDPRSGRRVLTKYGCDTCHTIPGVLTADSTVGPPLNRLASRSYLAGRIENTPENLIRWIRFPRSVDNGTAMPDTGVTERDGRDIAAYLYTLR
jgi:cytochrome c2